MKKILELGGGILLLLFFSCKKVETLNQTNVSSTDLSVIATAASGCYTHPIIDDMPAVNTDGDSTELPTILVSQRTNPYTLSNMRMAYNNLGYAALPVNATNLYVRFLPNSVEQLSTLDSIMDVQNLELFDTPMDYDVLQEGDYYQDPSIPDSLVTWQYAVVTTNFQAPTGITYQVLSQIHIPNDDYTALETEGERLASIQDSIICSNSGGGSNVARKINPSFYQECDPGYHWDATLHQCVPDNPPPPSPPPPAPDVQVPAGLITVTDNNLGTFPGVRNARLVAKRWFKIERTYTDNNGHFQFTKRFKHKVKINVKFKNSICNIRGIRGVRIWQSLYVINKTIGVFSSTKSTANYNFDRMSNSTSAKGNRYWVAATTINAIQELRDYGTQLGFSLPPTGLNIYITNWGIAEGIASTPLFGKRFIANFPVSFINTMLVGLVADRIPLVGPYLQFFAQVARTRLDMAIDYHRGDMTRFTSDFIKGTVYHESSHASQYTQAGNSWYTDFVKAELAEIENHPSGDLNPYGDGTTSNSPIIALGEAWGYHIGHFLADQRYGTTASCQGEQKGGLTFCNFNATGLPHIDVIENFNPLIASDPFHWIPKGLMYDLIDNGEPVSTNVNDQVFGLTTQQIFAALQNDVTTILQYRARLLQQTNNNQLVQINNLFISYGY